jgi:hypothetical protein
LKFAGDALIAEWKPTSSNTGEDSDSTTLVEANRQAVWKATQCAVRIVNSCSDFPVNVPINDNSTRFSTTIWLNVHAGVGFGTVVGTHVGDCERQEYVILGDALQQITQAMTVAQVGEVVASTQVISLLKDTMIQLDKSALKEDSEESSSNSSDKAMKDNDNIMDKIGDTNEGQEEKTPQPQVIAYKKTCYFTVEDTVNETEQAPSHDHLHHTAREIIVDQCRHWDLALLEALHSRISPYVHPVVLAEEVTNSATSTEAFPTATPPTTTTTKRKETKHRGWGRRKRMFTLGGGSAAGGGGGSSGIQNNPPHHHYHASQSKQQQALAELRDVCTVFIHPDIDMEELTGEHAGNDYVLDLLNRIMWIICSEVDRFEAHLRQFIVDDKGACENTLKL